jgi:hypothetical protein
MRGISKRLSAVSGPFLGWKLARPEKSSHPYQDVPVLGYHKFSKNRADRMTVRESVFEAQMRSLRENGYHVLPLEELFILLDFKGRIPPKAVVITIDHLIPAWFKRI